MAPGGEAILEARERLGFGRDGLGPLEERLDRVPGVLAERAHEIDLERDLEMER